MPNKHTLNNVNVKLADVSTRHNADDPGTTMCRSQLLILRRLQYTSIASRNCIKNSNSLK